MFHSLVLLEWAAVLITLVSVWLTVRQNIWCWPTGIAGVTLFGILFFHSKLYADMALQGFYVASSIYGWYEWMHGGEGRSELQVSRASLRVNVISIASGLLLTVALGLTLKRTTDAALPMLDSGLSAFSLVAQLLMTRKLLENWIIWIVVDVVYVGMFIFKDLYPTAGLYVVFTFLASLGYVEWKRTLAPATI